MPVGLTLLFYECTKYFFTEVLVLLVVGVFLVNLQLHTWYLDASYFLLYAGRPLWFNV